MGEDKYAINFPLLSDPDLGVHRAFGAWGEKTMYGKKVEGVIRSTFVLEGGQIVRAFYNVKVDGHVDAVLAALGGGAPEKKAAPRAPKKAAAKKTPAKAPKKTAKKK